MAWYDEIVGTTKGNVQGLVDALRNPVDTTKQFLKGGEKNRKIASALLQGNTAPLKQAFAEMTPQDMENAMMNVGMTYAPMGMFIGKGSKVWNPNNEQLFLQLEKQGMSPEQIWSKTGTLRGKEGLLRQEIPDVNAKITDNVYEGIVKNKRFEGKMGNALTHPDLYKAYPDVADIGTGMYAWKTPEGSYDEITRTITAGGPGTTSQKSAALHEIMHDIQRKEGFATGGTPESTSGAGLTKENQFDWAKRAYENSMGQNGNISDDELLAQLLDKPYVGKNIKHWEDLSQREKLQWLEQGRQMAYRRLAGEAEARLVQNRMKLSPEERLKHYPYAEGQYGLDVPYESLIVKK